MKKRIIIGISGASGIPLAEAVLRGIRGSGEYEIRLIVSESAKRTIELEYEPGLESLEKLADVICDPRDISDSVSSGSFRCEGMIVVPCSMKTLAGIVSGYSDNLLLRAADVTMKERRKLVLVPRETPLSILHTENLNKAARLGCIIIPPMISFYSKPQTVEEIVDQIAGRILDAFDIDYKRLKRWETPVK